MSRGSAGGSATSARWRLRRNRRVAAIISPPTNVERATLGVVRTRRDQDHPLVRRPQGSDPKASIESPIVRLVTSGPDRCDAGTDRQALEPELLHRFNVASWA